MWEILLQTRQEIVTIVIQKIIVLFFQLRLLSFGDLLGSLRGRSGIRRLLLRLLSFGDLLRSQWWRIIWWLRWRSLYGRIRWCLLDRWIRWLLCWCSLRRWERRLEIWCWCGYLLRQSRRRRYRAG